MLRKIDTTKSFITEPKKESKSADLGDKLVAQRQARFDGEVTRETLLEEACKVFAEEGFSAGSSKVICQRANVNLASVNYYFGGKSALYTEVLLEAQRQLTDNLLMKIDTLGDLMSEREYVRAYLEHMFRIFLLPETPWYAKVLVREYINPSSHGQKLIKKGIFPNMAKMNDIFAKYLGLPSDNPTVLRTVIYVFSFSLGVLAFEPVLSHSAGSDTLKTIRSDTEGSLQELLFVVLTGMDVLRMSLQLKTNTRPSS